MKKVLLKLQEARKIVKNTKIKKEGKNTFSKYSYFTPEQVENIVSDACFSVGLLPKFDLIESETKLIATLTIYEIETAENLIFRMVTDIPVIKATNIAQQLGGTVTYSERYLKMTAFGIVENTLDFDSSNKDNSKSTAKKEYKNEVSEWLSEENYKKALNSDIAGINATLNTYDNKGNKGMKKAYREALKAKLMQLEK